MKLKTLVLEKLKQQNKLKKEASPFSTTGDPKSGGDFSISTDPQSAFSTTGDPHKKGDFSVSRSKLPYAKIEPKDVAKATGIPTTQLPSTKDQLMQLAYNYVVQMTPDDYKAFLKAVDSVRGSPKTSPLTKL